MRKEGKKQTCIEIFQENDIKLLKIKVNDFLSKIDSNNVINVDITPITNMSHSTYSSTIYRTYTEYLGIITYIKI